MRRRLIISSLLVLAACDSAGPGTQIEYLENPAATGSMAPNLALGPDGAVVMSWIEPDGDGHALKFSALQDSAWSPSRTAARGDDWFVNWADFPSVVPLSASFWAAHWLVRQPAGGYAYDVFISHSLDGGESWSAPRKPYDDDSPTEHGFVSLFPDGDGLAAIWLDGRYMLDDGRGMTLRSARFDRNLALDYKEEIDGLTCDCCPTDVALTDRGAVAVYRDRTPEEIRDIAVSRFIDGEWTPGRNLSNDNWHMPACPVNGPKIDALGHHVTVAWFTAADDRPRVQIAWSADAGENFSEPTEVASGHVYGRVGVAMLDNGDAVVSWLADTGDGNAALFAARVDRQGTVGPAVDISRCEHMSPLSTPQLVKTGGDIVAAWTVVRDGTTRVHSAVIPGERFDDEPPVDRQGQNRCSAERSTVPRSSSMTGISPSM